MKDIVKGLAAFAVGTAVCGGNPFGGAALAAAALGANHLNNCRKIDNDLRAKGIDPKLLKYVRDED